jgi:serine/threonine-protein kinase RsbW
LDQLAATVEASVADDVVSLAVPADGGYLGVLRTATAGLAARLQYPLDRIEDLRIAVDEACAMLLVIVVRGTELRCRYQISDRELTIAVTARVKPGAALPGPQSFPWQVLTSLTAHVSAELLNGYATIRMVVARRP